MSKIKSGDMCIVVRNTGPNPCTAGEIGRTVTVTTLDEEVLCLFGLRFWQFKGMLAAPCAHCGLYRSGYLETDLQPIRGPGMAKSAPTSTPKRERVPA